jgi:hypothetical protein
MDSAEQLQQAINAARNGDRGRARTLFQDVIQADPRNELAWMWLSGLYESVDDQIWACENVLRINPRNARVRDYLEKLKQGQEIPEHQRAKKESREEASPAYKHTVDYAVQLEEDGRIDEALEVYNVLAGTTKDTREFDRIYHQINKLEGLKAEKIKYVSPGLSLVRLTVGWPILYFLLVMVQSGLRIITLSTLYLWLGLIWVALGGFFLALVETRSRHPIWKKLSANRAAGGSATIRFVVSALGWLLISVSFLLIMFDSLHRLQIFEIPIPTH